MPPAAPIRSSLPPPATKSNRPTNQQANQKNNNFFFHAAAISVLSAREGLNMAQASRIVSRGFSDTMLHKDMTHAFFSQLSTVQRTFTACLSRRLYRHSAAVLICFYSPHDLGRLRRTGRRTIRCVSSLRLHGELVFVDPVVLAIRPHAHCSQISSKFFLLREQMARSKKKQEK